MDGLKQWALTLIIGGLAGTFVIALSPNGAASKTLRTVIGIFIVLVVCSPLSKLENEDGSLPVFNENGGYGSFDEEDNLKEYLVSVCRDSAENEIRKTASELGIKAGNAEINMYIDENYCIIIQEILVRTEGGKTEEFYALLEERLGVPVRIISR